MKRPDSTREIVDLPGRTNLSEGYAAVFATIVIWSTPSLFQYYLNRYYDPWTQNFYRYLVACLAIALPGLFIAFTATFCWALYGILVKRPSAQLGSIRSFGLISLITSALLLPLTLAFGEIGIPLHVGAQVNLILIISAVSCITLAHVLYYVAIREIGVALAQTDRKSVV